MTVTSLQCQEVQVIKWGVVPLQHFIISSFNKYSMTTWYALSCILTFIIDHFISNLEMQCSPHRKSSSNLSTQILYPCPQQSWIMSRDILNLLYNTSSHSVVSLFRFITCMPLRALTARDKQLRLPMNQFRISMSINLSAIECLLHEQRPANIIWQKLQVKIFTRPHF